MTVNSTKFSNWGVILFILINLITSNFLVNLLPPNLFQFILAMWSPAIFAIIFAFTLNAPIKSTLGFHRSKWSTYLLSIGFPAIIGLSTTAIGLALGYLTRSTSWLFQPSNAIPTLIIWIIASLGEEIGWRGYLHTSMKGIRHAPLLIGVVWALWHFSQVITESGPLYTFAIFTPTVILISYVLSSLREYGGNIWTCALYHGIWNFLRIKVLFGNPAENSTGLFITSSYQTTDMEGLFGLISLVIFSIPVILYWYKKTSPSSHGDAQAS